MVSKHTTSIVDISEIEDDVDEILPGHRHAHAGNQPTTHNGNQQRQHNQQQHQQHQQHQQQQQRPASAAAQFYLYNEDLNPQQRIPNVLSNMINSPPGSMTTTTTTNKQPPCDQQQQLQQMKPQLHNSIAAIDYNANEHLSLAMVNMDEQQQQHHYANQAEVDYDNNDAKNTANQQDTNNGRSFTPAPSCTAQPKADLGTISGVYFPCVQNIFGVILFIRMVWIVGTAGVLAAFTLVFICCCVTLTTSISLSAIATNGIVPAGGPYFMISRSLGPECGGAVGTMFFLGTTVAGAMYITGAVEIMLNYLCPSWGLFGDFQRDVSIMYNNIRFYGTILLVLVGILVWIGVKFVSKLAPIALFCVLMSICSIYAGIFINYNGRPDLMICVLGDRLVTLKNIPWDDPMAMQQQQNNLFGGDSPFSQESNLHQQQQQQQHLNNNNNQQLLRHMPTASNGTNNMKQLSSQELASLAQLRRTKALCTYEKLRYIYCPSEPITTSSSMNDDQNSPTSSDHLIQMQSQNSGSINQQEVGQNDEAKRVAELFKRQPNMSNCDPYFRLNKDRIHLEQAVPGIASGVLFTNLKPRFRQARTIVSYDDGINTNLANDFNQIFVDITTSFTILISIYFPSCTGILAGSNRSGDLKDAQQSIPRGTITAQLTTSFVYLSCIVLFGSTFNNLFIRDKFGESMGGQLAVTQIAWPHPYVILIGGLLSTLGASLQSLVGAPRILQGIAKDEVIPAFNRFAKLSARGEPETAIIFTLCLSWFAVLIGNLDFIAPILTISLVMCYFFINLACAVHSLLGSPNWRPRFKHYHWSISSLGCLLCLFVMIVSSLAYFLVAIFIACCIYKYIEYSGAEKEWGDGKQGLALSAARYNLLRLKTSEPHTKNWRPQLLLFCKLKPAAEMEPVSAKATLKRRLINPKSQQNQDSQNQSTKQFAIKSKTILKQQQPFEQQQRQQSSSLLNSSESLCVAHPKLLTFASQLKAGKGLTLVSSVIEGDFKLLAPIASKARQSLQESMNEEKVKGFADVVVSPTIEHGLSYQIQTAGLGGLKHNTVIVGWPEHWRRYQATKATSSNSESSANPNVASQAAAATEITPTSSATKQQHQQQQRGSFKQSKQHNIKQNEQQQQTRAHLFIELMRNVQMSQNALLVIKGIDSWPESCDKLGGFIDIWWIVNDGGLLMLLPHLLRQHKTWRSCQLRIFTIAQPNDNIKQMREDLHKFLYHLRIDAQVDIVELNNADISDYAYERTLMMEQRSEIIKRLNVNRKQSLLLEQEVDGRVMRFRIRKPSSCDFEDTIPFHCQQQPQSPSLSEHLSIMDSSNQQQQQQQLENGASPPSRSSLNAPPTTTTTDQHETANNVGSSANFVNNMMRPNETNVRRMHTALTLNEAILKRSKSAKLVIINLPGAPKDSTSEAENNYMEFIEIITEKLERVLLVQNGGREVITIHS